MTLAYLAWITVCIVWGTTYLAIRVALETVPVFLLAGIRWFTAGVLLAGILVATGRRLPGRALWGPLLLLGFLMNVLGNGFVVWGEQYVPSGLTAVVIATVPFWSVGIEALLPRGEKFSLRALVGPAHRLRRYHRTGVARPHGWRRRRAGVRGRRARHSGRVRRLGGGHLLHEASQAR